MTYSPNHYKVTCEELNPNEYTTDQLARLPEETVMQISRVQSKEAREQKQFNAWKSTVDKHLIALIGMSSDDLTDASWYDYFDDGLHPVDAIACAADDYWYDMHGVEMIYDAVERYWSKKGHTIDG